MKMKRKIVNKFVNFKKNVRVWYFSKLKKKKLNNKKLTIISQNCIGCVVYHELGLQFDSPTINGYFESEDYLKFLTKLKYYLSIKPIFAFEKDGYPVCKIDDILFYAVHYKTFDEFLVKWEKRKERVNYDNIFVIMNERDNCSYEIIKKFDKLKYKNKVIFTLKEYKDISSSFQIKVPDKSHKDWIISLTEFKSFFSFKKYFDKFNFIAFFNGNTKYNKK